MNNNQKLSELAQAVQRVQAPNSVVDLIYNEETGQFAPSMDGAPAPAEGAVVTGLAKEGFA